MKVTYTKEQKRIAIQTYKRTKSYAKTIRILGYPSNHVLHDWVKGIKYGRPKKTAPTASQHYSFEIKRQAVDMMLQGVHKEEIAKTLTIHNPQIIYKWVRIWRAEGDQALMKKPRKESLRTTKRKLLESLPDDTSALKEVALNALIDKAILEQELELLKKNRASSQNNCQ